MSLEDLIRSVLAEIRKVFYANRPISDYKRDERALTKAILRYGVECQKRGWQIDPSFIEREVLVVLWSIKKRKGSFDYLPAYLEGAITRHVNLKAEEHSAEHKRGTARRAISAIKSVVVESQTMSEKMVSAYQLVKSVISNKAKQRRKPEGTQQTLFGV